MSTEFGPAAVDGNAVSYLPSRNTMRAGGLVTAVAAAGTAWGILRPAHANAAPSNSVSITAKYDCNEDATTLQENVTADIYGNQQAVVTLSINGTQVAKAQHFGIPGSNNNEYLFGTPQDPISANGVHDTSGETELDAVLSTPRTNQFIASGKVEIKACAPASTAPTTPGSTAPSTPVSTAPSTPGSTAPTTPGSIAPSTPESTAPTAPTESKSKPVVSPSTGKTETQITNPTTSQVQTSVGETSTAPVNANTRDGSSTNKLGALFVGSTLLAFGGGAITVARKKGKRA